MKRPLRGYRTRTPARVRIAALLGLLLAVACASPALRLDHKAARWGLERRLVEGDGFEHVIYFQPGREAGVRLHVYLDGDGSPWKTPIHISQDPTPRRAYALELMHLDSNECVYVGRPCYHGLNRQDGCSPTLWTDERYSAVVVGSMGTAIRRIAAERQAESLILVGYSGGGVLAVLLAEELETVAAVVTVAANLDVDAWTDLHGYSRLDGSLAPPNRPPLPPDLVQLHLAGGRDTKVPIPIIESFANTQPQAEIQVFPSFDHACCWKEIWPSVLETLAAKLRSRTQLSNLPDESLAR